LPTDFLALGEPAHCVGRERELAHLGGLLHDAALGSGSVALLAGGHGSGKSRLLRECARIKSAVAVLSAQCSSVPMHGQDLRSQLRELPMLVQSKPIAVLVDDVHLAAAGDLDTLDAVASMSRRERLVLIASVLDEAGETPATEPLRLRRWIGEGARYHTIGALGEEATELLVRGLLKTHATAVGATRLRDIVQTAQGNPRFAIELTARAIHESASVLVPPSAQMVVEHARRTLSKSAFETLLLCSALGERFADRLIAKVSERPPANVAVALQEACDLGILIEDALTPGVFGFRQAAVQKAAYLSIISPKRRLLHQRIVRRLSEPSNGGTDGALLAYQWDALADHEQAACALTAAAERLFERGSFAAAADAYERAAGHRETGTDQWFVLAERLLKCYSKIGNNLGIIPLVEKMRSAKGFGTHRDAVRFLDELFFAYLNDCDRERARDVAEHMAEITHSRQSEPARRARLVLAYVYSAAGQRDEGVRFMTSVDSSSLADDETHLRHLLARATINAGYEPPDALLGLIDRAVDVGAKLGISGAVYACTAGVDVALRYGDLTAAEGYSNRAAQTAAANATLAKARREIAKNRMQLCLFSGNLTTTRELLVSNLAWRDSGRYNEAFHAGVGVFVGMRTGDLSIVDAYFDPALLTTAVSMRDAELCGLLLPGFAEVMHVRGMDAALQAALASCLEEKLVDAHLSIQLCAASYGSTGTLHRIEALIENYLRDSVSPVASAHASLVRAILARRRGTPGAAAELARDAAQRYGKLRWRLYEALALEAAGDLRKAGRSYAECGATADAARVAVGQSRKVRRAPFGARLTAREREVARLIARRRSDREIARALEISVRTVHHHVEAILSKVGVRRRSELTGVVAE
jgi:DNA-binding CsgD family transcriptional regulator